MAEGKHTITEGKLIKGGVLSKPTAPRPQGPPPAMAPKPQPADSGQSKKKRQ